MATRFYLPSTGTPDISPSISAEWEATHSLIRQNAVTTKIASAMTTIARTTDGNADPQDICFVQYISDPIAGQTISAQTLKFQMRQYEYATGANLFTAIGIRVLSGDGGTVRGTILAVSQDDTELAVDTLTNRQFSATTTEVVAQEGDVIVIEVGYGGDPSPASQRHNGAISIGDDSATDLGENNTDTAAYNPWVEFANTISFPVQNALTAKDLFGAPPTIDKAELIQNALTAKDLFGAPPTIDKAELALIQNVVAKDLFGAPPTIDKATLVLIQDVVAKDLFGAPPTIDKATADQESGINELVAKDLFGAPPTIDKATLTLIQAVVAKDLFGAPPTVDKATLVLIQAITAKDLFGAPPTVDKATLVLIQAITAKDLFGAPPTVDKAILDQDTAGLNALVAKDIFGAPPTVEKASLVLLQALVAKDLFGAPPTIDKASLTLIQALVAKDLFGAPPTVDKASMDEVTLVMLGGLPTRPGLVLVLPTSQRTLPDRQTDFSLPKRRGVENE
jgi:hypothetical protein